MNPDPSVVYVLWSVVFDTLKNGACDEAREIFLV